MKALSVKQPWADMISLGAKTAEVRSWRTSYRGPLLICSSTRRDMSPRAETYNYVFNRGAYGVAICTVELVDIVEGNGSHTFSSGGFDPSGLWCWVLKNPTPVNSFPVKGRLGLFNVEIP